MSPYHYFVDDFYFVDAWTCNGKPVAAGVRTIWHFVKRDLSHFG